MDLVKIYLLLKMGDLQLAMLVHQRVGTPSNKFTLDLQEKLI